MGSNGYKGVMPKLTGIQRLYLDATGIAVSSEAYATLCDWYVRNKLGREPRGKVQCLEMQQAMLKTIYPNTYDREGLVEHLRQIFAGDKVAYAELIIRRYGLDKDNGTQRMLSEFAQEFAQEFGYAESTVRTAMMSKALDALKRDEHFREALVVPELTDSVINYWKFICMLLTKTDQRVERVDWNEETKAEALKRLQAVGVNNPRILDQTIETWLSTLPEEARLAAKLRYGLGYPAIGRTDDYIAAASGFDLKQRNLLDFLTVKLNRASLCAIFGVVITEVNYRQLKKEMDVERSKIADVETLGLPVKVAAALRDGGVNTAYGLLEIDMFSEDDQPWSKHVPSKYWRDVVQLWIDLRIKLEIGEYQFEDGCYAYEKVS